MATTTADTFAPPVKKTEDITLRAVSLKVGVTLSREGKVESCCNYDITGQSGNLLLVLPPMTHIQDMPR
jgi:hypothetical protein